MPLNYLVNLDVTRLPFETRNKSEIRRISKLVAVGLLRAEFRPNFMAGRTLEHESATVLAVTAAGRRKITRIKLGFLDTAPGMLT